MFLTPIFYSVPERWRTALRLNPMAAVVEGFRAALFGTPIPSAGWRFARRWRWCVAALGFVYFRRMEQTFADRV